MNPSRGDDAVVDLLDVILREGVVIEADVIVTVADVPLVGISLRAAVAGMTTMAEYGLLGNGAGGDDVAEATRTPAGASGSDSGSDSRPESDFGSDSQPESDSRPRPSAPGPRERT